MELKNCNDTLNELEHILKHANNSIPELNKDKNNLDITKLKFEQLFRDVNNKINTLETNISQLKTNFEREIILNKIDLLYDMFCKFDIDILLSYLEKTDSYEKKLKSLNKLYLGIESNENFNNNEFSIPSLERQSFWELILPRKLRHLFFGKERIENIQKTLDATEKCMVTFMNITKDFRDEFKRILIVYDFIEEEIIKENKLCLPLISTDENLDIDIEDKKRPGPKEKIWTKGRLNELSMRDVEIILNELYNRTNNFLFKDVDGVQKSKYNNIWAAIVFYSAKTIGYVDPNDKPGQPYERTIKKIISNVSRNTIAEYYNCIDKFYSTNYDTIRENMTNKYSSFNELEIKFAINEISEAIGIPLSKCHFLCANINRISSLIEEISFELEKLVESKLSPI